MNINSKEQNKALVLKAFDTLFNQRDYENAAHFWSPNYIQHSAHIGPGRDGLFNLVLGLPPSARYESGTIVAEGDYVTVHGRYTGNGQPRALVTIDIVRMQDGRIAEHWDVWQSEVTAPESQSGLPMFGTTFPQETLTTAPTPTASLTVDEARKIVAPLYDALNEPSKKDVIALLAEAANSDYRSFSTNEESLSRDQLADVFKTLGEIVPDLQWSIKDIQALDDHIVVRGEASGTPVRDFFGAKPTGKRFKTMSIDVFTVKGGRLSTAFHIENWIAALEQISY
jgi:predicted SnoaL-like aldol condensation-catalyzing enzyme